MESLDLKLESLFLFNPNKKPNNPKASEVEQMDAKRLFFCPPMEDLNQKRNLVGMAEGIVLFFDGFGKKEIQQNKLHVFVLQKRVFLIQEIEESIFISLIFQHFLQSHTDDSYGQISHLNHQKLKIILKKFLEIQNLFFGSIKGYFSSTEEQVQFIEKYTLFIDSFFEFNFKRPISLYNFLNSFTKKKLYSKKLISYLISQKILIKYKSLNLSGLLIYRNNELLLSNVESKLVRVFNQLIIPNSDKFPVSNFLLNFLEINNLQKMSYLTLSNKNQAFQIFVEERGKIVKKFFSIICWKGYKAICFWKTLNIENALHSHVKQILEQCDQILQNDNARSMGQQNVLLYNNLLNSIIPFENLQSFQNLNINIQLFFIEIFENAIINNLPTYYKQDINTNNEHVYLNFVNDRIIALRTDAIEKADIRNQMQLICKNHNFN